MSADAPRPPAAATPEAPALPASPVTGMGGLRRGFVFLVLAALLVVALVVDESLGAPGRDGSWIPQPQPPAEAQAVVTPDGTIAAAWYCAEGTSQDGGRADQSVAIANAGEQPLDAVVTIMRGEEAPVLHPVQVPARSRTEVRIADIVQLEDPGVVVEVFGPDAAVEHILRGSNDFAALPCARRPSDHWLFAGGRTVKDARDFVAVFNPFEDAAVVDMTFFTEDGPEAPEALQSLEIPGRTRVSVPVHEHVLRKQVAGLELIVRSGRVVAERSIHWDGTTGRRGLGVYPGVNEVAEEWHLPEGLVQERVFEDVWVLNPGLVDTQVEIQPELDGDAVVEPVIADVPARSAVSVRMNDAVPAGTGHSLRVTAVGDEDVVVAQEIVSATGAVREGYALVPGLTRPSDAWVFAAGSADDAFDEWIIVANPTADPLTVGISVLAGGVVLVPEGLGELEVPALQRRSFRLGDALKRSDLPVVVTGNGEFFAVRGLFQPAGVSFSPGIPMPGA